MIKRTFAPILLISLWAASAPAQDSFSVERTTKSALLDTTGTNGSQTTFAVSLNQRDADLYINEVRLSPGNNFASALDLIVANGANRLDYFGGATGSGSYQLGSAISGDQDWFFYNPIARYGAVDANVPLGSYDYMVEFIGGEDANATDVLTSFQIVVEVIERLDVIATLAANPNEIFTGQTSQISMTVANQMSRNFVSSTWYWGGGGMMQGNESLTGNFRGDWFDQVIAPGGSRTDLHSEWLAEIGDPFGTYTSDIGVVGGVHLGDQHFIQGAQTSITVVPEPATLAVLGLGGLLAARRRRK